MLKNHLTPHDKFFRSAMAHHKTSEEFFEHNLPDHIKAALDFNTLKLEKESFIDDKFKQKITDLLFSADFNKKKGYLYMLVEHQSTSERFMPFRLLKYIIAIMDNHLKKADTKRLPVVYPMIFYSGKKPYKHSTNLFDLFEEDKKLAEKTLLEPYQLIDLTQIPDEKLKEFLLYGTITRAMKHIYDKDFVVIMKELAESLNCIMQQGDSDLVYMVLEYAFLAAEIPNEKELKDVIETGLFIDEGKVMTLAEKYRQKGRQEGRYEGLTEGIQKGRYEGLTEGIQKGRDETTLAVKLLREGRSTNEIVKITGLSKGEIDNLKKVVF